MFKYNTSTSNRNRNTNILFGTYIPEYINGEITKSTQCCTVCFHFQILEKTETEKDAARNRVGLLVLECKC